MSLSKTAFGSKGGIPVQKDSTGYKRLAFINAGKDEI
jgi:hypothetical protein